MSSDAKPADVRARILKHMNADHQDSISLYLRNFASVPYTQSLSGRMDDISPSGMTLSYEVNKASGSGARNTYFLPFDPPLEPSLTNARAKLVELSHAASAAVGQSPIRVRKYVLPSPGQAWVNIVGLLFGIATFVFEPMLEKGAFVPTYFLWGNESLRALFADHRPAWLAVIAAIHVGEALVMYPKAWKHCPRAPNVLGGEGLGSAGWAWVASTVLGEFSGQRWQ